MKIVRFYFTCLLLGSLLQGCYLGRAIWYNVPGQSDYKIFPARAIHVGEPIPFPESKQAILPPPEEWAIQTKAKPGITVEKFLRKTGTIALLILKNDTLVYEKYFFGNKRESIVTSFSISKSILSVLAGIAIDKGILHLDEPIGNYLPEFQRYETKDVTVRHLLQMTSGLDFQENYYNPLGDAPKFYYGKNLRKRVAKLKQKYPPGTQFRYKSCDPVILGWILEKVTGKTVSEQLEELWKQANMQYPASWSLDQKDGSEKMFCGINARPIDFLRLGQILVHRGQWQQKQLLPAAWIDSCLVRDTSQASPLFYQYYWYLMPNSLDYTAEGFLGQNLYISPQTNTVIVRFSKRIDFAKWRFSLQFLAGTARKPKPIFIPRDSLQDYCGWYEFTAEGSNDSSIAGKRAKIFLRNGKLWAKSDLQKKSFPLLCSTKDEFFYLKRFRNLCFYRDVEGKIVGLTWKRHENEWYLTKIQAKH
ncbi:MAG: serine hydrolase [Bacteroidia bacterium]|nr:serine hydrolase [Bacteroidia bacterium]